MQQQKNIVIENEKHTSKTIEIINIESLCLSHLLSRFLSSSKYFVCIFQPPKFSLKLTNTTTTTKYNQQQQQQQKNEKQKIFTFIVVVGCIISQIIIMSQLIVVIFLYASIIYFVVC